MSDLELEQQRNVAKRLINYAPLSIPKARRLQTLATVLMSSSIIISVALTCWLFSFPRLWPILIPYCIWAILFDDAPNQGGRPSSFVRTGSFWKYFADYFPISLIKTQDLPRDRTYVFGYHPHGIIGVGAISVFGTEATGFSNNFPGIKPHLLTLATNFQLPFFRDLMMAMGICSVAYKSCQNILRQGPGSSITIVVGGATEALSARPGTADLTLKRRLGFIKLAIREGADLVPVFSFGENDIFNQLTNRKGTKLRALQKRFQSTFGFTLPLFWGRGIFNYTAGMMPMRHPIVSVVGRPIRVSKDPKPSQELLEEIQSRYIEELTRIWDNYKDLYAINRKSDLSIIE